MEGPEETEKKVDVGECFEMKQDFGYAGILESLTLAQAWKLRYRACTED